MEAYLQAASRFVAEHHAWAGLTLGLVTFLESLVLIGAFVPATALMLLAGGLVASGALDPVSVLMWCAGGAALGDAVSYGLGRRLGASALRRPLFVRHRRAIARTRLFSRRYGVASIFIGRFFGPLRAFVPVMAGMLQMKRATFQLANVASAVVWVAALLTPGYLAAQGLAVLERGGLIFALAGAVVVTIIGAIVWFARQRHVERAAPGLLTAVALGGR
jgi:membrane protein DedA with SNARE-associated domain